MSNLLLAGLGPVLAALEELEVRYRVGGSLASSVHGVARATMDVDLAAEFESRHVQPFVLLLSDSYYSSEEAIKASIGARSSFNVIHFETMLKTDIFPIGDDAFERSTLERAQRELIVETPSTLESWITTAEDVVLVKLRWYRDGGGVSNSQWRDALGVLQVQAGDLDHGYMSRWADALGLSALLERALEEGERP